MKRTVSRIALACIAALGSMASQAANTDPFDFDYEIAGGIAERPALIFNDGSKTYIQPRAGQVITAVGGHPEGPYVVVDGTPETITYTVAGRAATAHWTKANSFVGGRGALASLRDDQPATFDGFTNRLILIGSHGALEPVRGLKATMPVANLVKALVPQGWTGSAQKDVDLNDQAGFATRTGENWLQALDQLMAQSGLYADVDFGGRHVRLHRDAPKSAALNYAAGEQNTASTAVLKIAAVAPQPSLLAQNFGAQAIRDGDDTHTQIRFAAKPPKELTFRSMDGQSLRPKWEDATNVMTIERASRFVVSDGASGVEVERTAATVYDFDATSPAHLEAVFDKDGETYFKFADSVVQVTVADVHHLGSGAQKGRYYQFKGTSEQFIVTADGNTVNVTRRHDVKYVEHATTSNALAATGERS
ncbi:TrbG/VirB9 family P-type conjugative transfer protein [Paraburkholderia sediminicola]|uniref:TrbG/VirB9 family P-type conjugative transfer protein n=1 Tax=Paraburkholderia sediminicola TaxID=458836 RepID=UPI0038BB6ED9